MPQPANIRSIEALETFRAELVVYLSKAGNALLEVNQEVSRMRNWVQSDQRLHWEAQVRRRERALEEARQALLSARLSNLRDAPMSERAAVSRAERALAAGRTKLSAVKKWGRAYDTFTDPLVKEVEKLTTLLSTDMANAVGYLMSACRTLDEYAHARAPRQAEDRRPTDGPDGGTA